MQKLFTLLSILLGLSIVIGQQIPIQDKYDGFTIGEANAPFRLEMFLDLLCPDAQHDYQLLRKVLEEFNFQNQDKLKVTFHQSPNVFHINAFPLSMVQHYILETYGNDAALAYQDYIFEYQDEFTDGPSLSEFYQQASIKIAEALSEFDVTVEEILEAFTERQWDLAARASWKFGAQRVITGTPLYYANGALIDNNSGNWGYEQWVNFIHNYTGLNISSSQKNKSIDFDKLKKFLGKYQP